MVDFEQRLPKMKDRASIGRSISCSRTIPQTRRYRGSMQDSCFQRSESRQRPEVDQDHASRTLHPVVFADRYYFLRSPFPLRRGLDLQIRKLIEIPTGSPKTAHLPVAIAAPMIPLSDRNCPNVVTSFLAIDASCGALSSSHSDEIRLMKNPRAHTERFPGTTPWSA